MPRPPLVSGGGTLMTRPEIVDVRYKTRTEADRLAEKGPGRMPRIEAPILIEEKEHSALGPSSFERVEACTASAILGAGLEPVPASDYSAEGTVMHEAWARCLTDDVEAFEFIGDVFKSGEHLITFDAGMADAVHTGVVFARGFRGTKWVERRVTLIDGQRWGWADLIVLGRPLTVVDMKFGIGIEVPATTTQTGDYGLMAGLEVYGVEWLKDGPGDEVLVNSIICQPRGRSDKVLKPHAWTRADLQALHLRILATARAVKARKLVYKVSENCRWCAAVAVCPALRVAAKDAAMVNIIADADLIDAVNFDAGQLDEALAILPALDLWSKRVAALAMRYMEAGGKLKSTKLVRKRSDRMWVDEAEAEAWLKTHGVDPFQPRKLLSPAMAEDKVTKDLKPKIGGMVMKKPAGLTMASRDDGREEVILRPQIVNAGLLQDTATRLLNRAKKETK